MLKAYYKISIARNLFQGGCPKRPQIAYVKFFFNYLKKFFYHFIPTANEDRHRAIIRALFNAKHAIFCCPKCHFSHQACFAQLFWCQFRKSRNDAAICCDRDQFHFWSTNPTNRRQLTLQQQMIRFVIETPLTKHQVGTRLFDLKNGIEMRLK